MWMRLLKRTVIVCALLAGSLFATGYWAHRQTQKVPEFYERAIATVPAKQIEEKSRQLDENVEQLQAQATQVGIWEASFSTEQINAWLTDQLPKRFPKLASKGLRDPRVVIENGVLFAAARLQNPRLDAVISCELGVQLTEQPNRIAVIIQAVRVGALPLPMSQVEDRVSRVAAATGLGLSWENLEGQSVALIDLPEPRHRQLDQPAVVETVALLDNEVVISGRTGEENTLVFEPTGPIYRVASVGEPVESSPELVIKSVSIADSLESSE